MRATRRAAAGALALAAAMGIGRFAYTALLPPAKRALALDDATAGALASLNLLGYLVGALVARSAHTPPVRNALLRAGLVATAACTALLAATTSIVAWAALRAAAGVASGLVFVLASAAALDAGDGSTPRPGLLYAGVGAGIALSGVTAALADGDWRTPWLLLAAAATLLGAPGLWELRVAGAGAVPPAQPVVASSDTVPLPRLAASYFLEGMGYIVSGTFAVVAVQRTPGLEHLAPWTWSLAGFAAIPSAILWTALGRRIGVRGALAGAFAAQSVGMALPSLSSAMGAALAGAVFFGGTFIGITALTMTAARAIAPHATGRLIASLTVLYGVGQVIGPIAAGALARRVGDPRPAVLAAAVAVGVGAAVVAWPARGGAPR